ncbi:MAG TPA: indolepyruvate ferredoxin oxidoreductase family protein, partial [Geminicoccaceae bacterium]|nr:indolepyruvate ferredoxin oxidoreductase family protein [Geminicoccaceae bacterium]
AFADQLAREIEGAKRLELHLAPPLLASRDPRTGRPEKRRYGPWILHVLRLLARLKGLRGTAWDPFGRTAERRLERQLIQDYETLLADLAGRLTPANHDVAVELASLPERIRGFGHVKERNVKEAKAAEAGLLRRLDIEATTPVRPKPAAASLSP